MFGPGNPRIQKRRQALGLTRAQAAKAAGFSYSYWCLIEQGIKCPHNVYTLKRIAKVLKVTVDELLQDDDSAAEEPSAGQTA